MKFRLLLILGVVALSPVGQRAVGAELPSREEERVIQQYLQTFNSGNIKSMLKFVRANVANDVLPPDSLIEENYNKQFVTWGRLTPGDERGYARPVKAAALDEWLLMTFHFSPNTPNQLAGIGTKPIPAPGEPRPETEAESLDRIRTMLANLSSKGFFHGVVLVARKEEELLWEAFGQANREKNIPNRPEIQFNLASVNKMFTAVAVARLEEQGKLSFSDTIRKHLPDYPSPAGDKITIHQLLTHTSGLQDIGGARFFQTRDRLTSPQRYIDVYGPDPLIFEPGARWQYSNLGFIVLGRIIEVASGQSYNDYVKEHIFQKAGMNDTGPFPLEDASPARARGYTDIAPDKNGRPGLRTPEKRFDSARYFFLEGTPAGYFFSTTADLLRFSQSLAAGTLLVNARQVEEVTSGKVPMFGPGEKYGYGFMEGHVHGARWFGHGGGGPGASAFFTFFPESGHTVVVLANVDPPAADWVAQRINDYLIVGNK